jgi:hypothetical protein
LSFCQRISSMNFEDTLIFASIEITLTIVMAIR